MKTQIIDKLLSQPWHMHPSRARTIIGTMIQRLRGERPDEDVFGNPLPTMTIVGDVAVIPVVGTLMVNVPDWFKEYGLNVTDANDIGEEITSALNNPAVSLIVLNIDSPGGWSAAGDKLFDLVEAANKIKPVLGWCADGADCCSSAYECAAPSQAILTGPYSLAVGCIGSYLAVLDVTEYWKMMGVSWEVFRSGEFKGMGIDGFSEQQRAFLQSTVDQAGATFRKNVSKYRTLIDPEDMQGQYFTGSEAAKRGFSAGTSPDLSTAIAKFRRMI